VRVTKVLRQLLGLARDLVIEGFELDEAGDDRDRHHLVVRLRLRLRRRGRRGRCGAFSGSCDVSVRMRQETTFSPFYDRGGERSWRHLDVGFATSELVCAAPRVSCRLHGPTVAELPFARHDSAFTRAFENLVVYEAIASSESRVAEHYGISWALAMLARTCWGPEQLRAEGAPSGSVSEGTNADGDSGHRAARGSGVDRMKAAPDHGDAVRKGRDRLTGC